VLKAIQRAGIVTGWRMTPQQSGVLYAERNEGSHSANIYVHYSAQRYSISLMDSSMVDRQVSYSAPAPGGAALASAPRTVHRTYNRWVQELDKAIRAQLATLGL
jgi:hypothetical protein